MAVTAINNPSSMKIILFVGMEDGKAKTKSKTFSNLKHDASNQDVLDVADALVSLQEYEKMDVVKQDNTLLA